MNAEALILLCIVSGGLAADVFHFQIKEETESNVDVGGNCSSPQYKCTNPVDTCCGNVVLKKFACCSLPNAVCCTDLLHCCPTGFKCDEVRKRCFKMNTFGNVEILPFSQMEAASNPNVDNEKAVKESINLDRKEVLLISKNKTHLCPDNITRCEENHTCCSLNKTLDYCCQEGYICALGLYCLKPGGLIDSNFEIDEPEEKAVATGESDGNTFESSGHTVMCPGGHVECPDGNTCCAAAKEGEWQCCNFQNATCCSDKKHCCPNGYKCDLQSLQCVPNIHRNLLGWLPNLPLSPRTPAKGPKPLH